MAVAIVIGILLYQSNQIKSNQIKLNQIKSNGLLLQAIVTSGHVQELLIEV